MENTLSTASTQYNFLKNSQFQLVIPRLPNVAFYTVDTGIPSMSVDNPSMASPFKPIPMTGETASFDDLTVNFIVDYKLNNYYEIYQWLRGYSRVNDYQNMRDYIKQNNGNPNVVSEHNLTSDIQLVIMCDKGGEAARVEFKDAFPVSLGGLDVTTKVTDVEYLTATVVFKYNYYEIIK